MTLLNPAYRNHVLGDLFPITLTRKVLIGEQLEPLQKLLLDHVKPRPYVRGHQQRMGTHNTARLSRYRLLKEYAWPANYKDALLPLAPVLEREATHWLLHFDTGDFLDEQDAWAERPTPVDFYAVALLAKQHIVVAGREYILNAGDAIQFAPSYRHEIPPAPREAGWLCFMVFRDVQRGTV